MGKMVSQSSFKRWNQELAAQRAELAATRTWALKIIRGELFQDMVTPKGAIYSYLSKRHLVRDMARHVAQLCPTKFANGHAVATR